MFQQSTEKEHDGDSIWKVMDKVYLCLLGLRQQKAKNVLEGLTQPPTEI